MPDILLNVILAGIFACLAHEGGHWLTALAFGRRLNFRFVWGRLFSVVPVPRWVWYMPDMAEWKQRVVAVAGFGTLPLPWAGCGCCWWHRCIFWRTRFMLEIPVILIIYRRV